MSRKPKPEPPKRRKHAGIRCPHCGGKPERVTDTRAQNGYQRRRLECAKGHRFTTIELPLGAYVGAPSPLFEFTLVRKDMRKETK